jgi:hypothetical protein
LAWPRGRSHPDHVADLEGGAGAIDLAIVEGAVAIVGGGPGHRAQRHVGVDVADLDGGVAHVDGGDEGEAPAAGVAVEGALAVGLAQAGA